jgi:hypothetical protein
MVEVFEPASTRDSACLLGCFNIYINIRADLRQNANCNIQKTEEMAIARQ